MRDLPKEGREPTRKSFSGDHTDAAPVGKVEPVPEPGSIRPAGKDQDIVDYHDEKWGESESAINTWEHHKDKEFLGQAGEGSDRTRDGKEGSDQHEDRKESLGRPSKVVIIRQSAYYNDGLTECQKWIRTIEKTFTNMNLEGPGAARLQHCINNAAVIINDLVDYSTEKLSILTNPNTGTEDRLHITVFVIEHLEEAIHDSEELGHILSDPGVSTQPDQEPRLRCLTNPINLLRQWLKSVLQGFFRLMSGLLTPKEWKLSGTVTGPKIFLSPTANMEITFGKRTE